MKTKSTDNPELSAVNRSGGLDAPVLGSENILRTFCLLGAISVTLIMGVFILPSEHRLIGIIFGGLLAAISWTDLRHYLIPDVLLLGLVLVGTTRLFLADPVTQLDSGLGTAAAYGLFGAIQYYFEKIRSISGMGHGDVKLAGALGLWLGVADLPYFIFIAATTGLVTAVLSRRSLIPFGPFLCLSAWVMWVISW